MASEVVEKVAQAIYESAPLYITASGLDIETLKMAPWENLEDSMPDAKKDMREAARTFLATLEGK